MLLAIVIGYLLNSNRLDRKEHRVERQEWDTRFKDLRSTHREDIKELSDRVAALEKQLQDETLRANRAEAKVEALMNGRGI